jgi:hypothetical protein
MSSQRIRTYLHDAAQKLGEEAVQTPEALSEEQLQRLERFAKLSELYDKTKPPRKPARWPVITILALVVLIIGLALLFKIPRTEVELELTSTDLQFTLPKQAALTRVMVLSEVGISDLKDIQLPRARSLKAQQMSYQQSMGAAMRLTALKDQASQSSITLSPMILPAGTLVDLTTTELPNQYRLTLTFPENTTPTLQVSVRGMIKVAITGGSPEEYSYPFPQSIQLQPATNRVTFDLTLPDEGRTTFSSHIPAEGLAFLREEQLELTSPTEKYKRQVSAILSGKLYLTELASQGHPLRIGEYLLLDKSFGLVRLLALEKDQLALQFHGKVHKLTTGWEENPKPNNLMPNYLEWLTMQRTLVLLWSSTLSVFVFLLGLWRWWKKTE